MKELGGPAGPRVKRSNGVALRALGVSSGMGHPTAEQVAQRALDLGLLDDRQLREIWANLGSRNVPVNDLLQLLVRREFMTNYQVERLVKGERSGFFFGDYKVLYLVGAGTFAAGVSRRAPEDRRGGGVEGAADPLQREPAAVQPVHSRGPRGLHPAASQHRAHLRGDLGAETSLPGAGIRRRLELAEFRQDPQGGRAGRRPSS